MSCHFVFTEAWLMNFNRWFLCAFTRACVFYYCLTFMPSLLLIDGHMEQSYWFICSSLCIGWEEVTSGQISDTGTICNSGVNQCNSFASEASSGFLVSSSGDVNADAELSGISSSPATERPGTYRQSAQIIPLWGGTQLTALAFCFGHTIFFLRHAWSSLCGVKRSLRATLLAFNCHHEF